MEWREGSQISDDFHSSNVKEIQSAAINSLETEEAERSQPVLPGGILWTLTRLDEDKSLSVYIQSSHDGYLHLPPTTTKTRPENDPK